MRKKTLEHQKPSKMAEEEVNSDTETSENSGSDDAETPQNEANEYEKQRLSRIAQNKSRMEAFGLHKIANSLMDLSQKSGKRKSQPKSKRVAIKSKEDDEYEPNDDEEEQKDDSSDSNLDSSSEEFEGKKKKKKANVKTSGSKKVLIPDNTLEFMGHCGERIRLTFPKAPDEEVKALIDSYPKGFNGFNCEQGERALRCIADLKSKYWNLRRLHMFWYPEFREEGIEGLPFPEGFNGFTLEESKEISGLIITLEDAYSRLRNYFQPYVHEGSKGLQRPEASGSHPQETSRPPTSHFSYPRHQASNFVPGPDQPNIPMFTGYGQIPPYWCFPMVPFGMAPIPWNPYYANCPQPYMANHPGMP